MVTFAELHRTVCDPLTYQRNQSRLTCLIWIVILEVNDMTLAATICVVTALHTELQLFNSLSQITFVALG